MTASSPEGERLFTEALLRCHEENLGQPWPEFSMVIGSVDGNGDVDFYYFHNYSGDVFEDRPWDYGMRGRGHSRNRKGRRRDRRLAKNAPRPPKPQPLVALESAVQAQRACRSWLARRKCRRRRIVLASVQPDAKPIDGWFRFEDLFCKTSFYGNVNDLQITWTRPYETAYEKAIRLEKESIAEKHRIGQEFIKAGRLGDIHEAQKWLEKGAKVNSLDDHHGSTLWHLAAGRGLMNVLFWLRDKMEVDELDVRGATALHHAAHSGHLRAMNFLMNTCNANVHARDSRGRTALLYAAHGAQVVAMDWLRDQGADLHVKDYGGCNAIHRATNSLQQESRVEALRWLAGEGVSIHGKDHWAWTAINKAAVSGSDDVVSELKRYGGDVTLDWDPEKAEGWTPVHQAAQRGDTSGAIRRTAMHTSASRYW